MNPYNTIQELEFGDSTNRLLSALINFDKLDTNLYVGTIEIAQDGESNFDQLPWIAHKVEKLQTLTSKLHDTAMGFNSITHLTKEIEESTQKSFPIGNLNRAFRDASSRVSNHLYDLHLLLKDMENAVKSIKYPSMYYVKNLYRIQEKSSSVIIEEKDKIEYPNRVLNFVHKLMESPMHYFLVCVSEADGTAFVSRGYKIASKVGAGYHEIWGDIHTNPRRISSSTAWQS